jgi:nucleotide-binding universal stress UspA family protein
MKEVLVLTDFSDSAKHAANSACVLAAQLGAGIILLHAVNNPANGFLGQIRVVDKTGKTGSKMLAAESARLQKELPENGCVAVVSILADGSLSAAVESCIRTHSVSLIVLGGRTSPNRRSFAASDVYAVINKASCPVLIVPRSTDINIKSLVLVIEGKCKDISAINLLSDLAAAMHFDVHIKYVCGPATVIDMMEQPDYTRFTTLVSKPLNPEELKSVAGLNAMDCTQEANPAKIDMLAFVHKKLPRFWQMFNKQRPTSLSRQSNLPMLVLPE